MSPVRIPCAAAEGTALFFLVGGGESLTFLPDFNFQTDEKNEVIPGCYFL